MRKQNFRPTQLDFGPVIFYLARHFGFCYGVENAIEISYRILKENPKKKIYMVSQLIHNSQVNNDLQCRGIQFILDTQGKSLIPWEQITKKDIVIIPAFGVTVEVEKILHDLGVETQQYNAICPFVQKVWNKSKKLGKEKYTIIIHGKSAHEETQSTFSHSVQHAPSIIICNLDEAKKLGECILGTCPSDEFYKLFSGRISSNFDFNHHLTRIGVVNQTTMLASETHDIINYFRHLIIEKYGIDNLKKHFADTRDTLCYATNDNQDAAYKLLETDADFAIVIGNYNSSNTSHIAMLCQQKMTTYWIHSADEIKNYNEIHHYNFHENKNIITSSFISPKRPVRIGITSGASCPDTLVDQVILKIAQFFDTSISIDALLDKLN